MRHVINRRNFLLSTGAAAFAQSLSQGSGAAPSCVADVRQLDPKPERAVSLRQLCKALSACAVDDKKCQKLVYFNGITRLDGYVLDPENHDIILWGQVEKDAPPLHFQDLVVALRSSHGRYVEVRGGTRYLIQPAISIDPNPEVWRALDEVRLNTDEGREQYSELCKMSQTVRVEGMPRSSRIAYALVDADYRMKMVSQGIVRLPVNPPLRSPTIERWRAQRQAAKKGLEGPAGNKARFWFEPGKFTYKVSYSGDTVFLDRAQVVLRDQVTSLSEGKLVDAAESNIDPFNRAFACSWSDRMEDTYRAEGIWRDMHNIFRHFAVARIMADRQAFRQAGFDTKLILDDYDLPRASTPDNLPGIGRVEEYRYSRRAMRWTGWNAICGGVSIAFNNDLKPQDDDGMVQGSGSKILSVRPQITAVSWNVTGPISPIRRDMVTGPALSAVPPGEKDPVVLESINDILAKHRVTSKAPDTPITEILKRLKSH